MTSFYAQKFVICVTILFQTFENRIVVKRDVFGGFQTLCIIIRYKKQLAIYYHSVWKSPLNMSLYSFHGKKKLPC